jgi:gamma-glutamyltranspeptidase / glutathione hydrolase
MPDDKVFSSYEQTRLSMRPAIMGRHGMVVSGHSLASQAGMRILERGGNAVDAGVAAGICLAVLQSDMVNFAGVAPIMIYSADTGALSTISGVGPWPRAASVDFFLEHHAGRLPEGLLRTVVPAAPDAWITALSRFGTMGFADVAADAIDLAVNGFPMHPFLYNNLLELRHKYLQWSENAAIYLPRNGMPCPPGEIFYQKDLGATLQTMADAEHRMRLSGRQAALRAARDEFYKGSIARAIVSYHRDNGGLLTAEDLADFSVAVETPLNVRYKEYTVFACGAWCQGPALLQALNLVEGWNLGGMGHNSADYIHALTEALKLVFADREKYYTDPAFAAVPVRGLLSKAYAADRRSLVDMNKAWGEMPAPGDPWAYETGTEPSNPDPKGRYRTPRPKVEGNDHLDTSQVCVVDRHGNCFSATPSDMSYTTEVIPGTGLAVSSRGSQSWIDKEHPCAVAGGKRPRLTPNPLMVFKNDRPCMVLGTPGGDTQCQTMLQTFLNMVEFEVEPQLTVEAPRFATFSFPNSFYPHDYHPGLLRMEGRIPADVAGRLIEKGHRVELWPDWAWKAGGACVIRIDRTNAVLTGAADPRRESYAIGW